MVNSTIISTKVIPPHLRANVVVRSRLIDSLEASLSRTSALTLVSAPAGYGKTTFVLNSLQAMKQPYAWLSLEPEDDSFSRFVVYLISALKAIHPSIGKSSLALLEGIQPPTSEIILSNLVDDLAKQPACVLVLDDYHFITSSEIHEFLGKLIEHAQPHLQIIITTRADPPLPLAKWRARNLLTEIRAANLRFTFTEATEFFHQVMNLDLPLQQIQLLEERTEGWVAGLQLAALSMRNGHSEPHTWIIEGNQRDIADYLMAEVFAQLPAERQDFLLQTSILHRMSASLCNAVSENANSQFMLESLEAGNLFVIPLDDSRTWFRYHHLFAEFLRKRLQKEYPEERSKGLHQRAGHWLGENRFVPEAIDHAIAAEDFEYAAQLLEPQAQAWMMHGEVRTILAFLKKLPNELVWKRWSLCMWYGWTLALIGEPDSASRWTNRLEELITPLIQKTAMQENGQTPINLHNAYIQTLAIRSIIARTKKDFASAVALAEQALHLVRQDDAYLKTIVTALLSAAKLESGEFDEAEAILRSSRQTAYRTSNPFIVYTLLMDESALTMMRGQLYRAHEVNLEALQLAQSAGMIRLAFLPQVRLGRVHYFWNQLTLAREYISVVLANINIAESPVAAALGYMTQAQIEQAEGKTEKALQSLQVAESISLQHHLEEMLGRVKGVRAQTQLSAGDEAAKIWLRSSGWGAFHPVRHGPLFNDESFFAFCRMSIESNDPIEWKRIEKLLEWRLADSERQARNSTIILIRLTQALLHQARKENERALESLVQALDLALPDMCIRPFLDQGTTLLPFLKRMPQKHALKSFAQKILASQMNHAQIQSTLLEPLSEQELKILRLMAHGHSNPQIAHTLVLAVSTVRWYVKQIFRKLEVHNRTQAAAQARKLNLV